MKWESKGAETGKEIYKVGTTTLHPCQNRLSVFCSDP